MLRSPKRYDSDPGLSKENASIRKRRHDDDLHDSFQTFTESIMKKLENMNLDFKNSISNLNTVIKQDLVKLTDATTEMKSEINNIRKEYHSMKSAVDNLNIKVDDVQTQVDTLQKSAQFNSDILDDHKDGLASVSKEVKKITTLENELDNLKKQNTLLKIEFNTNDQRERLANLEIVGVPEEKNEKLIEIILNISKHIGVELSSTDIVSANRITPKIKVAGRSRIIIAKFNSRLLKDNILSSSRKCRTTSSDIGLHGDPKPIYINEHLTYYNKQILKKCKDTAKAKEYQYIWTRNGRIFVRKNDTSAALHIKSEEDIKKL